MSYKNFLELQKDVIRLFEEEKFQEAINRLESSKENFPNKIDRIGHWLVSIHCLQNNKAGLAELNEVLSKGLYWNPQLLSNDTDLSVIQSTEEFAQILHKCEVAYNTQKQNSQSLLRIMGNSEADTSVTALHWKSSNVEDFSEQIATDELQKRYLFSFIQSSQLFSHDCYHWDNYGIAKTDILDRHSEFETKEGLSIKNEIIFGASQGADTAIKLSLEPNTIFNKVIAIVPTLKDFINIEEMLKYNIKSNLSIIIITGDKDIFYENVINAMPIFEENNIDCELIVVKGMKHTIPTDFEDMFQKCVYNLIQKSSSVMY